MTCKHHVTCGDCYSPVYVGQIEEENEALKKELEAALREKMRLQQVIMLGGAAVRFERTVVLDGGVDPFHKIIQKEGVVGFVHGVPVLEGSTSLVPYESAGRYARVIIEVFHEGEKP